MPRLLTDEQARFVVDEHLGALVGEIYGCRPLEMSSDEFATQIRETLEEKLVEGLEGLMEPDEGGGVGRVIVGFEIRRGRPGTTCVWGNCEPGEKRKRDQGRGAGFSQVVILDRESFPACRRHRRELEEILCSLLPDTSPVEIGAVA